MRGKNNMLEEMKKVVGELYELYGPTTQVVRLSQILDYFIYIAQENNMPTDYLN